jgi:protein subunit release factor A
MWKQNLESKGISEGALPKKIKALVQDYNEIEAGMVELKNELAAESDLKTKAEIQADIAELEAAMNNLSEQIARSIATLKLNPDGTVGEYTAAELEAAWQARRQAWLSSDKKKPTKRIF